METWISIVLTRRKCKRSMEVAKSSQNGTLTCMHPLYIECCFPTEGYIILVLLIQICWPKIWFFIRVNCNLQVHINDYLVSQITIPDMSLILFPHIDLVSPPSFIDLVSSPSFVDLVSSPSEQVSARSVISDNTVPSYSKQNKEDRSLQLSADWDWPFSVTPV